MLVCIPIDSRLLGQLRADGIADVTGYAATPDLYEAMGYTPDMDEDAEFAALTFASVMGSVRFDAPRCVAVAHVAATPIAGDVFGAVKIASVRWKDVTALFVGEDTGRDAERELHSACEAMSLADAWDSAEAEALTEGYDLLWFAPEEADTVAGLLM